MDINRFNQCAEARPGKPPTLSKAIDPYQGQAEPISMEMHTDGRRSPPPISFHAGATQLCQGLTPPSLTGPSGSFAVNNMNVFRREPSGKSCTPRAPGEGLNTVDDGIQRRLFCII